MTDKIHEHHEHQHDGHRHEHEHSHAHHEHEHNHGGHDHEHEHNHENGCGCACGHCHSHGETSKKTMIIKIILSAAFFVVALAIDKLANFPKLALLGIYLIPYFIIGFSVLKEAIEGIFSGDFFDENFLMSIATIGAFAVGEYPEAVLVMLLSQIGEFLEGLASAKSRRSITEMMNLKPDFANLLVEGAIQSVDPEAIQIGQTIVVKPGEKIPLDGVIVFGSSSLDTSSLTGESLPQNAEIGTEVLSGSINLTGLIHIQVTKPFEESTVSKIMNLVQNAEQKKAKTEKFITKFSKIYTPAVVFSALALAIIPSIFVGNWSEWIQRALIFLVVSCPCALVISVPLSFFAGIGAASKKGILIKGSNYLELLANLETAVFDKTGTLTKGNFAVTKIFSVNNDETELLKLALIAEENSNHPIAKSIVQAAKNNATIQSECATIAPKEASKIEEIAGKGIKITCDNITILCGKADLLKAENIHFEESSEVGTIIYIAKNNIYSGYIVISDQIKPTSKEALVSLKKLGVKKTVMLTGDNKAVASKIANELSLDETYSELLPQDKVSFLEQIINAKNGIVGFVGDGVNDAPVLTRADIGIAMGGVGSDAAIEAADVVLMDDNPLKIPQGIKIARKTIRIVKQNITFALGIKAIVLVLGVLGIANMWLAVFADVGVSVLAILNSMRSGK